MILSIRHKGLRIFYETGNGGKLPKEQLAKISRMLTALDALSAESDIRALGSGIHLLKGAFKGFWPISVTGNYRIIFTFKPPDVFDIDYPDYH
jgi:toxin HigB-1